MWFAFALITTLSWGIADLFYKKGSDSTDSYSHLKTGIMVGLVMGLHAVINMLVQGLSFDPFDMVRYLPVSALYILSMLIGYLGLRYLELSIASPVQNSSGAITALILFLFFRHEPDFISIAGITLITFGVMGLAVFEKKEQLTEDRLNDPSSNAKYKLGILAITFPLLYALLDALGTAADGVYLNELELISEDSALLAYEFTWLLMAVLTYLYLRFRKKQNFKPHREPIRAFAAIFETAGQFFYVFAMADNAIIAAPMIASYSIVSLILSRIFLKEKLSRLQNIFIAIVMLGIAILG
jgi:drug/metabolite transporter (DMT)-like permease